MQLWTAFALAVAGWCVPLVLGSSEATFTTATYEDLKKNMCSPFEVLKPTEPCCEPTCLDDCSHAICRRAPEAGSVPCCVCRQGYVRHEGSCIRKESCPLPPRKQKPPVTYGSYDSYRTVPLPKSARPTQRTCGHNEKLTQCRPYCEATCTEDCTGVPTPKSCIREPSCVCKDGYVRHKGRCLQKGDCPKRNPLSGEYIDFEVVSLEGMKSDEDFDFPSPDERREARLQPAVNKYEKKKLPMLPVYLRTVTSGPKSSGSCECNGQRPTEKPALFPPLCACRGKPQATAPTYEPKPEPDTMSYESTEEDCDIVPYAPPLPSTSSYARNPSLPLFPPTTQAAPSPYYPPRKTVPAPPVHRVDFNEPLDHFYGSGQATSAQQNSAGQEEYRKPMTIWPPVSYSCKRCGSPRKQR